MRWGFSKLFVIFKSGDRLDCGNYRGISIMNTLAKICDILFLYRFELSINIDKCQAGAQKGRSGIQQRMALRLLCDFSK